ncbi:exocyst complex component 5-like [Argonauta hians]
MASTATMLYQELEQEPFNQHEFVERLAWRTMGSRAQSNCDEFDPMTLHAAFERMITDLKEKNLQVHKKVERLENSCKEEEKRHWQRVAELQRKNQSSYSKFQELDERINFVATKVVHLGDQLEGVNTPRACAVEAQRLMNYFSEFLSDEDLKSAVFTDPFQLQLAADIIQKLHLIAQELPNGEKFEKARQRISDKYKQVENELIEEFSIAHTEGDTRKMRRVASVLQNFKSYGQCIESFIEETQKGCFTSNDIFEEILPLCTRTNELINNVFANPEIVMGKLVQKIYLGKLQETISKKLDSQSDPEQYLTHLYDLYTRTARLSNDLSKFKLSNDSSFLNKQTKSIFHKHLEAYIGHEIKFLHDRCSLLLQRYYNSKNHQKKKIQSGGFRREFQAVIHTVNINIGPTIENYGGEIFLSQELAMNILQETKLAFKRCKVISSPSDLPSNAVRILETLIQFLVMEHIDYAVELGLQAIPLPDARTLPEIYFFDVIGQANTLFHLFEKQFMDSLVPMVLSSPKHSTCLQRKRELRDQLETKIDLGLDRSISAIIGAIRHILVAEQKKSDFKPDLEANLQMRSEACARTVIFLHSQIENIRLSLDGKNVDVVLTELGTRFHRLIFEHFQQFQYNSLGGMLVICDVNEYRKAVKEFKIPLINQLFDKLHALCNLLMVVPETLQQVCTEEPLAGLDKSVILTFVQLRVDFRSSKLASLLK